MQRLRTKEGAEHIEQLQAHCRVDMGLATSHLMSITQDTKPRSNRPPARSTPHPRATDQIKSARPQPRRSATDGRPDPAPAPSPESAQTAATGTTTPATAHVLGAEDGGGVSREVVLTITTTGATARLPTRFSRPALARWRPANRADRARRRNHARPDRQAPLPETRCASTSRRRPASTSPSPGRAERCAVRRRQSSVVW